MTKWAVITVVFYITLVILFVIPSAWWLADVIAGENDPFFELVELWSHWLWWIVIGIIVLIQALLLLFPVSKVKGRPKPQRALWVSITISGILFSLLLLGVFASAAAAIWGDDQDSPAVIFWAVFIPVSWFIWAFIFYRFAKTTNADCFMVRTLKWLITGSILELLVAVPCHVIVRHKNVCCAQGLTFYGIAAGLAVMALAFGPGIAFLILKRAKGLKPADDKVEQTGNKPFLPANIFTPTKIAGAIVVIVCFIYIGSLLEKFNYELKKVSRNQADLKNSLENIQKQISKGLVKTEEIFIGKPFPQLEFKDLGGNVVNIGKLKGKVVLIVFWATWCGPCTGETPNLTSVYNEFKDKGLEIIGISLDTDREKLNDYLEKNKIQWPNYYDGKCWKNEISSRFGIHGIPKIILIDREGIVRETGLRGDRIREAVSQLIPGDFDSKGIMK